MNENLKITDIVYIMLALLFFYILIDYAWLKPKIQQSESRDIIKRLKKSKDVKNVWNPKSIGIAMNIDNDNFERGLFTIACLKKIGCNLPIYVSGDLDDKYAKILKSMRVNLTDNISQIDTIINSPFRQVLYISPGIIFLDNPLKLFNDKNYAETGTLFWKTGKSGSIGSDLIRKIIPYNIPNNPILMKTGGKCQESKVILLDKSWHLKGLGKMNVLKHENITQSEIYWISLELAGESYHFYDAGEIINGMESYKDDNSIIWLDVHDVEKLDLQTKAESPLDYFRKTFSEASDSNSGVNKIFNKEIITPEQKMLMNEYRKVDFHVKEIV